MSPEWKFLSDADSELERARLKFPDQDRFVTLAALTEEVGELAQGVLQNKFETHKGVTYDDIYKEAVQVAVMAMRIAFDCKIKGSQP